MKELTTEAKVGLLTIVIVLAIIVVTRRIADTPSGGAGTGVPIYATFDSAAGLTKATSVEIAGVPVGEVEEITREGNKARVKMRIKPNVQLPLDSRVVIRGKGILGDKIISIIPGAAEEGPSLRAGDTIKPGPPEADLDTVIKRVDAIAQDVQAITGNLRDTLGTPEGQAKLEQIRDDLATFSDNLAKITDENRESTREIVENLRQMSERLNQVVDHSGDDLDETFGELKKAAVKLDSSLASIDSVAGKIDRGEGTIGKLVNDDETVDNLNEAISGVNNYLDAANRIHVYVNYEGEFRINRKDFKNQLLVRIQPHEDYGYILGISDDPVGRITEKTTTYTTTDQNGNITSQQSVKQRTEDPYAYLFTAQFVKRWGNVDGRIGLKESTGGVGADYFFFHDKFRVSADVFEFSRGERVTGPHAGEKFLPRIKVGARYDVYRHTFIVAGGDDLLNDDLRAFYVGAGFEFNDDDLKYVAGSIPIP